MQEQNKKESQQKEQGKLSEKLDELVSGKATKRAVIGGVTAGFFVLLGSFVINVGFGSEAKLLLQSMLPSVRFLCSTVMTASATILALMLTMLSMSGGKDVEFKKSHYEEVLSIARLDAIVFSGGLVLLLFCSVPISESGDVPQSWFIGLYYFTLVASALLGGALMTVVIMLYNTIVGFVRIWHPDAESHLIHTSDNKE